MSGWSEISFTSEAVAREREHEAVARHEAFARAGDREREQHEAGDREREHEALARVVARHETLAQAVDRALAREREHEAVDRAVAREHKAVDRAVARERKQHEAAAQELEYIEAFNRALHAQALHAQAGLAREQVVHAREQVVHIRAGLAREHGSNRPSNALIEDISTDSVNRIESAIKGKAPRPPRPEKTPQARRQSVTGFITSIFKYKKQMEMETLDGTDEEKPAGSDSSEPHLTTLGLAHIFPYEELMEATNGFKQQVGEGGFSSVYLGKLRDKREVAVKVLYDGIKKRFEQFINEVTVLSRLRHPNLVSLYGCTDPETHKLLIVYEFVPNDTLASHLHGERPPLSWALRIQIAIEIAMALAYLHSQVPSLIHRDVKSSNILLDNDFHPKLADFGMCRLVPWDTTYVSTLPQGTVGYRDPEYDLNFKLTNKSDVYSFGVVLLELISGKQAVDVNRDESEIYLFKMALDKILNRNLWQLVDSRLGYDSESEIGRMINSVAELACVCLQPEADKRPPMAEVLMALNGIKNEIQ